MASLPKRGDLPQIKKKARAASQQVGSRSSSKDSKRSKESKEGSTQGERRPSKVVIQCAGGKDRVRQTKSAEQRAKEAVLLLAHKDPFEDWRKNMVNEKEMSMFQRQLKSDRGLETLQSGLADEAKQFKNFWMKELPDSALFDCRTKFGPHGMKAQKVSAKKMDSFNSDNCGMTEEGLQRTGTNRELFKYFGSQIPGDQPSLTNLAKLLAKSQTYGANLDRLAKDEQKRQAAKRAEERAARLCRSEGFHKGYKKSTKHVGDQPTSHFHRTVSTMSKGVG